MLTGDAAWPCACVQARERSEDFIFADDDVAEPVWEHEARFKGRPMTRKPRVSCLKCPSLRLSPGRW
jgi:hypothetical protein